MRNASCPCGKTRTITITEPIDLTAFKVEGTATRTVRKVVPVKLKHCCGATLREKAYLRRREPTAATSSAPPRINPRVAAAAHREAFHLRSALA
jgi:hypothetical protein